MEYKKIQLKVLDDGMDTYKSFKGIKICSQTKRSQDGKSLISQRIYQTQKGNYVYYERTDVNWNYWNGKMEEKEDFDPSEVEKNTIFEVVSALSILSKYFGMESIEKLEHKLKKGDMIEHLDI